MKSSQEGGEEESTLWKKELTAAQYDILAGAVTLSAYANRPHRVKVLFSGVKNENKTLGKETHEGEFGNQELRRIETVGTP